jgi:hypothetical protein
MFDSDSSLVSFKMNGINYDDEILPEITINNTISCTVEK